MEIQSLEDSEIQRFDNSEMITFWKFEDSKKKKKKKSFTFSNLRNSRNLETKRIARLKKKCPGLFLRKPYGETCRTKLVEHLYGECAFSVYSFFPLFVCKIKYFFIRILGFCALKIPHTIQ